MGVRIAASIGALAILVSIQAQGPVELRFCLRTDPRTLDPLLASDEASETIRYLTSGVLVRFNRETQRLEPELASSWRITEQGRRVDFVLRPGVRFADGSSFGAEDVVATFNRLKDPSLNSPIADAFLSGGGDWKAQTSGPGAASVYFAKPVAGLEMLLDQLPISPAKGERTGQAVLGPFFVTEYRSGQYVQLRRNPNYWKTDESGIRLPRIEAIRLDIQTNRETELLRFRRGEIHFVDKLEPEAFELLSKTPAGAKDAGPSLDAEFFWFNQKTGSPMPAYKLRWFQSTRFRQAISSAVNRDDIVRVVYRGYARPAAGPVSPANRIWFNDNLRPRAYDPALALKLLREDGFRLDGSTLKDAGGRAVEFSLITNAGSTVRSQIGAMIQQDLKKIGIQVNFTPMEFQSLIERITKTNAYEACLLGLTNVEIDPNSQINVWLSSGTHHAWNPQQAKPATLWEAEIDRLMRAQAAARPGAERKKAFDRVQEIIAEQVPMIYLAHPDVLLAVSPVVRNAAPSALPPHIIWNIEYLALPPAGQRRDE